MLNKTILVNTRYDENTINEWFKGIVLNIIFKKDLF